jgi:hypothetical protein
MIVVIMVSGGGAEVFEPPERAAIRGGAVQGQAAAPRHGVRAWRDAARAHTGTPHQTHNHWVICFKYHYVSFDKTWASEQYLRRLCYPFGDKA